MCHQTPVSLLTMFEALPCQSNEQHLAREQDCFAAAKSMLCEVGSSWWKGPFHNESLTTVHHNQLRLMITDGGHEAVDLHVGSSQALSLVSLVALERFHSMIGTYIVRTACLVVD